MSGFEVPEAIAQFANSLLIWIGFGTVIGLLSKAILPGKDPGGPVATVCLGVVGSVIGAGTLAYFFEDLRVAPLSPAGIVVAIGGSSVILFLYRLLAGRVFPEKAGRPRSPRARGRRRVSVIHED